MNLKVARPTQGNAVAQREPQIGALGERDHVVRVQSLLVRANPSAVLAREAVAAFDVAGPAKAESAAPRSGLAVLPCVMVRACQRWMVSEDGGQLGLSLGRHLLACVPLTDVRAMFWSLCAATLIVAMDVLQRHASDVAKRLAVPLGNARLLTATARAKHRPFYRVLEAT